MKTFTAALTMTTMLLIFLFDPTELGLGIKIIPNIPESVLLIAQMLGNITWLAGCFAMIVSALMCLFHVHKDDLIENMVASVMATITKKPIKWFQKLTLYYSIFICIVAMGSGFWFIGSMWMLMIIILSPFRTALWVAIDDKFNIKTAEELIDAFEPDTPVSNNDTTPTYTIEGEFTRKND